MLRRSIQSSTPLTGSEREREMAQVQYYCGTTALKNVFGLHNAQFAVIGGERSKHNRYDGFSRLAGHPIAGADAVMPVTRTIFYKSNPSLHKCDARCVNATATTASAPAAVRITAKVVRNELQRNAPRLMPSDRGG